MRLEELALDAVERRVKAMKANAKAAKDRARQQKAQADMNAERLEIQRAGLSWLRLSDRQWCLPSSLTARAERGVTNGRGLALRPRNWRHILNAHLRASSRITEFQ